VIGVSVVLTGDGVDMIYRSAVMMVGPFCCLGADVVAHSDVVLIEHTVCVVAGG